MSRAGRRRRLIAVQLLRIVTRRVPGGGAPPGGLSTDFSEDGNIMLGVI